MIPFSPVLLSCLLPCLLDASVSLANHSKGHVTVSHAEDFHHASKAHPEVHRLVVSSAESLFQFPKNASRGTSRSHPSGKKLQKGMSFLQSGYTLRALHPGMNRPKQLWGLPKIIWVIMVDVFAMMVFLACIPVVLSCAKKKRPTLK